MKQAVTPLRLGSDRISSLLVRYAIPSIIAMTSSSLYNIVDSISSDTASVRSPFPAWRFRCL